MGAGGSGCPAGPGPRSRARDLGVELQVEVVVGAVPSLWKADLSGVPMFSLTQGNRSPLQPRELTGETSLFHWSF